MTQYTIDDAGNLILPDRLTVGGDLDLCGTNVTALPDGLKVGGDLDLYGTNVTALPDGLTVGFNLDLSGTKVTALPADIKLVGCTIADAPVIPNIHAAIWAAASQPGALDMSQWHKCETTHCRAGWAVTLAGAAGRELERRLNNDTAAAAMLIYAASDPSRPVPDFYASNEDALADMARRAGVVMAEAEDGA